VKGFYFVRLSPWLGTPPNLIALPDATAFLGVALCEETALFAAVTFFEFATIIFFTLIIKYEWLSGEKRKKQFI